jgi:hypothetical protein
LILGRKRLQFGPTQECYILHCHHDDSDPVGIPSCMCRCISSCRREIRIQRLVETGSHPSGMHVGAHCAAISSTCASPSYLEPNRLRTNNKCNKEQKQKKAKDKKRERGERANEGVTPTCLDPAPATATPLLNAFHPIQ